MVNAEHSPADSSTEPMAARLARLESDLVALRQELARAKKASQGPSPEALQRQREAWDLVLGLTPEVRQQRAQQSAGRRTLEDASLRFVLQHAGKLWIALLVLGAAAIAFRDRLA